jgi:hypothetical protein
MNLFYVKLNVNSVAEAVVVYAADEAEARDKAMELYGGEGKELADFEVVPLIE